MNIIPLDMAGVMKVIKAENFIMMWNLKVHERNDFETWRGMVEEGGNTDCRRG